MDDPGRRRLFERIRSALVTAAFGVAFVMIAAVVTTRTEALRECGWMALVQSYDQLWAAGRCEAVRTARTP